MDKDDGASKDNIRVEHFYGDKAKLKMFLTQLKAVFKLYPKKYPGAADKVLFAALNLKGSAFAWFEPTLNDYLEASSESGMDKDTRAIFHTFANFEIKIKQVFGVADEEATAERMLHDIKQKGSTAQYYALFKQLEKRVEWNEKALAAAYYRGLSDTVKDRMEEVPDEYQELVEKSIEIDNRLYERRMEKKGWFGKPTMGGGRGRPNYQTNYGDPMDLDAMKQGRPSRSGGPRFRRTGFGGNKERERRKKENLCYNCGKSGHRAKECHAKAQQLHMMDDSAGIGEQKADTPMKRMGHAKKEPRTTSPRERLAMLGISLPERMNSTAELAAQKDQPETKTVKKEDQVPHDRESDDATDKAVGGIRQEAIEHARLSWTACYDDACPVHYSDKEGSGWFPQRRKRKARKLKNMTWDEEQLSVLDDDWDQVQKSDAYTKIPIERIGKQFQVAMNGHQFAVIKTRYHETVDCDPRFHGERCNTRHMVYAPDDPPKDHEECVMLSQCTAEGCELRDVAHTHTVKEAEACLYPFEDWSKITVEPKGVRIPRDKILTEGPDFIMFETEHWRRVECDPKYHWTNTRCGKTHEVYAPYTRKKARTVVTAFACKNQECAEKENPHSHEVLGEPMILHPFQNMDEEDWEQVESLDMMQAGESETSDNEEISKFIVIRSSKEKFVLATNYWRKIWCQRPECPLGTQHQHEVFDDTVTPRDSVIMVDLPVCQDLECQHSAEVHVHKEDENRTKMDLEIPPDVLRYVFEQPPMEEPAMQKRQALLTVDERSDPNYDWECFPCSDDECSLGGHQHMHQFNVDPEWPHWKISTKVFEQMIRQGWTCGSETCEYREIQHVHFRDTKNEEETA
jgi:hypothetical protein